jgi:hypothetical protein
MEAPEYDEFLKEDPSEDWSDPTDNDEWWSRTNKSFDADEIVNG